MQQDDSRPVLFPAFRSYLLARETINDELMALVVGAGIASTTMSDRSQETLLPELVPDVPEVQRLNQTVRRARALWDRAPSAVTRTAIPYVLSVYGVYLADAVGLLQGLDYDHDPHEPDGTYLHVLHGRIETATGTPLPAREIALFELIQIVRNRLAHQGGTPGSRLAGKWRQLTADAKEEWIRIADRPILDAVLDPNSPLDLGIGELNATLAVTHRLAHRVNTGLVTSVPADKWAEMLVRDYRERWPRRYGSGSQRLRRLRGYARHSYSPIQIADQDLEDAAARVDVLYQD